MNRRAAAALRHERTDRGAALLIVIGLGLVMVLLITTGLSVAISGMRQASTEANTNSALDAAYAGVEDYLARLNADANYTQYGNPASKFSITSGSTVKAPPTSNPAFTVATGGAWGTVPGSGGQAHYRYEVDNSLYKTTGVIRLRATGLVGSTVRTVLSNLRVRGFVDYVYFTDFEIQDPQISGQSPTCVVHAWEGRASTCTGLQFGASDHLNGPVHSNDTLVICGSQFDGAVTTANTAPAIYTRPAGCAAPKFGPAGITRAAVLAMPSTNTAMLAETRSDQSNNPGCLYTGPTTVTYNGDGTMTVVSPWTQYTNTTATSGSNPSYCGNPALLHKSTGATVAQLDSNLLYVQDVPVDPTNPNYSATDSSSLPNGFTCLGPDGFTPLADSNGSAGWSFGGVQHPAAGEVPASGFQDKTVPTLWSTSPAAYGCRNGDLYVSGTVTVQTTAASQNYVYVTGDIKYQDKNKDLLGLVGQNAVLVWNPIKLGGGLAVTTPNNREIDAAILSVAHTFMVQNWDLSVGRGTLTVFGSIAQKFRGAAGQSGGTTGYAKNYAYDPLLVSVTPPKFLAPSATTFVLIRYASVPLAFDSTGAAQ